MLDRLQTAAGTARARASRLSRAHWAWLTTGLAVALIAVGSVASLTIAGSEAVPPPVTLRGSTPDSGPPSTNGLEFVPPPVIDFGPTTSSPTSPTPTSVAESPPASAASSQSPDEPSTASTADSPDGPAAGSPADSPDQPGGSADSVDDADSLDTPDTPDG
jgi:hypothetical protein